MSYLDRVFENAKENVTIPNPLTLTGPFSAPGIADFAGRTYYVNNITGSSSNTGLSWANAVDQLSTAITLSEAFRLSQPTNNQYVRNTIVVQGTGTAYSAVSALPNYCDIVGYGANAWGNGTGIARIDGAGAADAIAGTARGVNFFNMQFIANGNTYWSGNFVQLLRSSFINCAFMAITANSAGGLNFSGSSGGLTIMGCKWISGSAGIYHTLGLQASGNNFDQCKIEQNQIGGTTNAIKIASTVTQDEETVFKNNFIGDSGYGSTLAINDAGNPGYSLYVGNYVIGTTSMTLAHRGTARSINNHCIDGTTGSIYQSGT